MWVPSLGREDPLEEGMTTHSIILPGESHRQRSLAGYCPGVAKSRARLKRLRMHACMYFCVLGSIAKRISYCRLWLEQFEYYGLGLSGSPFPYLQNHNYPLSSHHLIRCTVWCYLGSMRTPKHMGSVCTGGTLKSPLGWGAEGPGEETTASTQHSSGLSLNPQL